MAHSFSPKAIRKAQVMLSGMESKREHNLSLNLENESLSERYDHLNLQNKELGEKLSIINADIGTKTTERQIKQTKLKKTEKEINELVENVHKNALNLTNNVLFAKLSHNLNTNRAYRKDLLRIVHFFGNLNDKSISFDFQRENIPLSIQFFKDFNENTSKILENSKSKDLITFSNFVDSLTKQIESENKELSVLILQNKKFNSLLQTNIKKPNIESPDKLTDTLDHIEIDNKTKFSIVQEIKKYTTKITNRVAKSTSIYDGVIVSVGTNTDETLFDTPPLIKVPILPLEKQKHLENLQETYKAKKDQLEHTESIIYKNNPIFKLESTVNADVSQEKEQKIDRIYKFEAGTQTDVSFREYDFYSSHIKQQEEEMSTFSTINEKYKESQDVLNEVHKKIEEESNKSANLDKNIQKVTDLLNTIQYNIDAERQVNNEQNKMNDFLRSSAKKLKAQLKLREKVYNIIEDQIEVHQAQIMNLQQQNKKLQDELNLLIQQEDVKSGNITNSAHKVVQRNFQANQKVTTLQNQLKEIEKSYKEFVKGDQYNNIIDLLMKKNSLERRSYRWLILSKQKSQSFLALEASSKLIIERRTSLKDLYETRYRDKFVRNIGLRRLEWYSNLLELLINHATKE